MYSLVEATTECSIARLERNFIMSGNPISNDVETKWPNNTIFNGWFRLCYLQAWCQSRTWTSAECHGYVSSMTASEYNSVKLDVIRNDTCFIWDQCASIFDICTILVLLWLVLVICSVHRNCHCDELTRWRRPNQWGNVSDILAFDRRLVNQTDWSCSSVSGVVRRNTITNYLFTNRLLSK